MSAEPLHVHYNVDGGNFTSAGEASVKVKRLLRQLGCSPETIRRVSIAMYEGEINMVIHANGGDADIFVDDTTIRIVLKDTGPGIKDVDALITSATRAAEGVIDGEITRAVRDTVADGQSISVGDYIAISGGSIVAVTDSAEDAVLSMLETEDIELCEIITLFVGSEVSDDRRTELTEKLNEIYDEYEIVVYEGGQEVYDYLVAVE